MGLFHSHGDTPWMVYFMLTGGTPMTFRKPPFGHGFHPPFAQARSATTGDAGHGLWHLQWLAGLDDAGTLGTPPGTRWMLEIHCWR